MSGNKPARPWTEDLTRLVIEKWRAGESVSDIARMVGKSRGSVMGRLYRLGVVQPLNKPRPITLPKLSI